MADDKYKDPFMAVSAAIIALTALGVIIFTKVPLKGLRPATELQEPSDQVPARLWQDPFAAVIQYLQTQPKGAETPEPDICPLFSSFQIQESVKKGVLPQEIAAIETKEQKNLVVLGVMVFGSRYAEEIEFRIRQRVAVLAALGQLGYVPDDAEHLNFLRLQTAHKSSKKAIGLADILPYEWLEKKRGQDEKILLLWLNDDSFQPQPLAKLNCLYRYLQSASPGMALTFKLIGPAGSTNLFNMIEEVHSSKVTFKPGGLQLFSPTATVSNQLLLKQLDRKKVLSDIPGVDLDQVSGEIIRKLFEERGIRLHRTIARDHQLAELLVDELENRQISLPLNKPSKRKDHDHTKRDMYGGHKDHLVLIAEWDTLYGRSLPEFFVHAIRQKHNEGLGPEDPDFLQADSPVNWVHRFSYLRGLDGVVPGIKEVQQPRTGIGADKKDDAEKLRQEEPIGSSQYDYLRRLADRIYDLNQELEHRNQGSIKAIGILGSDFYDKYLVLQALKQRFPEIIFFTTDLDARLLHELYNDWTRNLVVASGFDLQLPAENQGQVPPFRSSYQTSVFWAVLQAFSKEKATTADEAPNPKVFEIGRHGAVDLQKPADNSGISSRLVICVWLILIFLWIIISGFSTGPTYIWQKLFFLTVVILFFFLYYFFQQHILLNPKEEPFSLIQGISVWPTEILRLLAFLCSCFFFITAIQRLRQNDQEIARKFKFPLEVRDEPDSHLHRRLFQWPMLIRAVRNFSGQEAGDTFEINNFWENYRKRSNLSSQLLRVICLVVLYFIIANILIWYFGRPVPPVRGAWSATLDFWLTILSVGSFLILTFFIFDSTRLLKGFIIEALDKKPVWNETSRNHFLEKTGWHGPELEYWMLIRLIAQRSDIVNNLIFYPFIVWLILFLSRWYYFDNWRTPIGLALIISLSAVITWGCALTLRHAAEKLRTQIINQLSREWICVSASPTPDASRQSRIRNVLDEVRSIRQGAFTPFFQNPVVQVLFVPFGGVGGLTLLDFLNKLS